MGEPNPLPHQPVWREFLSFDPYWPSGFPVFFNSESCSYVHFELSMNVYSCQHENLLKRQQFIIIRKYQ